MSDDATLRALAARATPGPWTSDGDKIRATAADALLPDNILVAYYTGHDHRLGLKTTGHPPTSSTSPLPVTHSPTVSTDWTASAIFTPIGASSRPRTLTATSTCGRRSVASSTASPPDPQPAGRP